MRLSVCGVACGRAGHGARARRFAELLLTLPTPVINHDSSTNAQCIGFILVHAGMHQKVCIAELQRFCPPAGGVHSGSTAPLWGKCPSPLAGGVHSVDCPPPGSTSMPLPIPPTPCNPLPVRHIHLCPHHQPSNPPYAQPTTALQHSCRGNSSRGAPLKSNANLTRASSHQQTGCSAGDEPPYAAAHVTYQMIRALPFSPATATPDRTAPPCKTTQHVVPSQRYSAHPIMTITAWHSTARADKAHEGYIR